MSDYNGAYKKLNALQKEAVDSIEGPVMVIAGPGTGKTQILTLRIAHILQKTDVGPDAILALTFTEAGARAMRERLHGYVGHAAYRVTIATFHEFASGLIKQYPHAYERAVGGRPATDLEKFSIIEQIIETEGIRELRPHGNPAFYIKPILSAIALMKREYITHDALGDILRTQEEILNQTPKFHEKGAHRGKVRGEYRNREKDVLRNRELLFLYRAYDNALTEMRLFDFEDMILETVLALEKNEDMLLDVQERYQYILADEHQDVNGSQNRILELLASFHERPNIFVVGDEKQAIYRFQGASLENFLFFSDTFPDTKTIALTDNYRSTQNILDLAHALITSEPSPADALRVPLAAAKKDTGMVPYRTFSHEAIEDHYVVKTILDLTRSGVPHEDIAVIVRSNREVEHFASLLRNADLPVLASADTDILRHPITNHVRALIAALVKPEDEAALFTVLHGPYWGIAAHDLVKVLGARNFNRPLRAILADSEFLTSLSLENQIAFVHVHATLESAQNEALMQPPHHVLAHLLTRSGFISHISKNEPIESGRVLRRLYDEIESLIVSHQSNTLYDVLTMFESYVAHGLSLTAPYITTSTNAIHVLTAHKSKGLEFGHVFLPHLNDQKWGDTTKPTYFTIPITKRVANEEYDALDDERKLLYVGMTRAKRGLYLSNAHENTTGRPVNTTPLLDTLSERMLTHEDIKEIESTFDPIASLHALPPAFHIDTSFLPTLLTERGISATALNNYLKSPWVYFYRNVLRIPELKDESALFGTALHSVLRHMTEEHTRRGQLPTVSRIKELLHRELSKLPLRVHSYTRLHERGMAALTVYLETLTSNLPKVTKEEYTLEASIPTGDPTFPEIRITGQLDRLDYDNDPSDGGTVLRVIDYKSGKPKTRGYIEGTTKDSTGDYKRQLTFYTLLLSLQGDVRLHTRTMVLSFIEPDEHGNIREESYIITDAEIEQIKQEIIRVALEIAHGAFLDAPCDPTVCDYCDLVSDLKMRLTSSDHSSDQ